MARLPQPGSDNGTWGDVLNDYLSQTHKSDGSLKDNAVTTAAIAPDAVTASEIANGTIQEAQLAQAVQDKLNTAGSGGVADGTITASKLANDAVTNSKVSPTAAIDQSKIANLTADLAAKAASAHTHTAVQISDSTATGRSLIAAVDGNAVKAVLALGNVDNTSDAAKNSATVTLTNKTIDGANNVLQNISQSAIAGLAASLSGKVSTATTVNGQALSDDVVISAGSLLPPQSGNDGNVLTTNGADLSWEPTSAGELHYLVHSDGDGWPARPADNLPVLWVGGTAPDDAPGQIQSGVGDVWIPASGDGEASGVVESNTQTASYALTIADVGKCVEMNVGTANNLTIPPVSTASFDIGSVIEILQLGAGQTTIVAGPGVTLRAVGSRLKLSGQYSSAALRMRAANEWVVIGDLSL